MTKKERETQELQERYGHLFDGYLDDVHVDYKTKKEHEEEARDRYGYLLNYAKPDNKIDECMIGINNMCRQIREKRENKSEQAEIRRQERIEHEKRIQQERIDRKETFVNSYLEQKAAEQKARREMEEQKRKEAEREQNVLNSLRRMNEMGNAMTKSVSQIDAILKKDEQHRKEYEEQMEWYRKQQKE